MPVSPADKKPDTKLTRGQRIIQNGGTPLMPEIGEAGYLVDYWNKCGTIGAGGMAPFPLSAVELQAWASGSGIDLNPFEFDTIREISREFVNQLRDSEEPSCPPPYGDPVNEFDRGQVSKKVSNAFKAFLGAK